MNNDRFWMRLFAAVTFVWLVLIMLACIAFFQVITAHAEPSVIKNGEYIIAEIHTQEDAVEIQEGPPINDVSIALDKADATFNPYQTISISKEEMEELRWVLALEAGTQGLEGEIACCEVVFNRVLSPKDWGTGVHGVLSKRGQFATYRYIGSSKAWDTPGQMETDAIMECIRRGPSILPDMSYVFFDTGRKNGKRNIKIGDHWFGSE